jgi:tetratricopeptide (TPR) repeat protein
MGSDHNKVRSIINASGRTVFFFLLISIVFSALIPLPVCAQNAEKPVDTIEDVPRKGRLALFKAQEKKDKGDYAGAADILGDYIVKNSDESHFLVHYNYGNTLLRLDKPEEALQQYKTAVDMEPRFWQGWLNFGETAYNLEQYPRAAEAIMSGYRKSPEKNPRLLYFAAAAYLMAGNPDKSKPILEELVYADRDEPRLDWYRALIMSCIDLGDSGAGQQAVDRMLKIFPGNPDAWELAYQFAASREDYRSAAVALTVKGYLEPLERNEIIQLGNLYAAIEVPWTAGIYLEKAMTTGSRPEDFERLASVYIASHESKKALETIERALASQPTAKLWSLLGDLYYMEENYEKSYDAFSRCYDEDPTSGRSLLMMGFCALELGKPGDAEVHLRKAAGFPDYSSNAKALLKKALQMQGS